MSADRSSMDERTRSTVVDLSVYSEEAVLKSAHRFTGKCFLKVSELGAMKREISLRPKHEQDDPDSILAEFLNDLLDQRLRAVVAAETSGVRDLIMAHALSRTTFVRPDLESVDPLTDPAHVAEPVRSSRSPS